MLRRKGVVLALTVLLVLIGSNIAFSQGQDTQGQPAPVSSITPASPVAPVVTAAEAQWVWGEIVSVDVARSEVTIKYLDYETDQEKEMVLTADDKTTYENAQSLADIQPKDTLSIDYVVTADGKNIAKNISVEKAEAVPEPGQSSEAVAPPAPATETAPIAQ